MSTTNARAEHGTVDKFANRRRMLAESASSTIAEHGFANTGLRDIAQHSGLSHGTLHYYFADKDDLVAESVWLYKSKCARRYDSIITSAQTPAGLALGVADEMATTLRDEASMHRLWYDLRNQALFDSGFSDTIVRIDSLLEEMVWSILERYSELAGRPVTWSSPLAYSLIDGLFQNALIRFLRGDPEAVDRLRSDCAALIRASA